MIHLLTSKENPKSFLAKVIQHWQTKKQSKTLKFTGHMFQFLNKATVEIESRKEKRVGLTLGRIMFIHRKRGFCHICVRR